MADDARIKGDAQDFTWDGSLSSATSSVPYDKSVTTCISVSVNQDGEWVGSVLLSLEEAERLREKLTAVLSSARRIHRDARLRMGLDGD